jgi:hypothetical protein
MGCPVFEFIVVGLSVGCLILVGRQMVVCFLAAAKGNADEDEGLPTILLILVFYKDIEPI